MPYSFVCLYIYKLLAGRCSGTPGEGGLPAALPAASLATRLWAAAGDSVAHVLAEAAAEDRPAPAAGPASPWDIPAIGGVSGLSAFLHMLARLNRESA